MGYLLVGVAALGAVGEEGGVSVQLSHLASNGIILHIVAYAITNMAAFLAVSAVYNATGREGNRRSGRAGEARSAPVPRADGLSLLAGRVCRCSPGSSASSTCSTPPPRRGSYGSPASPIFTSLISLYYYLNVVRQMYIEVGEDMSPIRVPALTTGLLGLLFLGMVFVGVYPAPLMDAIQHASDVIMSVGRRADAGAAVNAP